MSNNIQTVNLADNINAAILKINQNFSLVETGAFGSVDSAEVTSIVNTILDSDYFISVINQDYFNQFNINVDTSYLDSDISANASAILTLQSSITSTDSGVAVLSQAIIDTNVSLSGLENNFSANASAILALESSIISTDSGVAVLSQAIIDTNAAIDGLVLDGVDSDLLANAIADANTTLLSLIEASDSDILVLSGVIDTVNADLQLRDSATNDRIDIQTSATNDLTARVTANEEGLSAAVGDVTQLGIDLNQLITDGIDLTPEQVTEAIGGALDSLTLRLDADSDKLTLEAAKIVDLNTQLTALDSDTGAQIQAEADARSALSATVALIDGRVTSQADDITTLTASVDSDFATVNQSLTTLANDAGASAVYALDLNVNNHIAGIRLDNDGTTANFAVSADTFKIINASDNEIQPFTVSGNEVELSNATVTGNLNIGSNLSGAHTEITDDVIKVFDADGLLRVKLGNLS